MDYTGNYKTIDSEVLGHKVNILEYRAASGERLSPCFWEVCSRCGKPIRRVMYVVQDAETDVEELYFGADCIKRFC